LEKPTEILIATSNTGKVHEFVDLLQDLQIKLRSLKDFPTVVGVAETAATFAENAALKACGYALQTGLWTLADDSGLEVDALGGAPGVFSARYGGRRLSDREKCEKLLVELEKNENKSRRAQFVCVIAFSNPNGKILRAANGVCSGTIAVKPSGTRGFGFDSIFIPDNFNRTFAELPTEIKHEISHRGRAAREISRFLQDFLKKSLDYSV
jgi:XTP/dITP diphosphohydrolase